jgi:hypothetical protein
VEISGNALLSSLDLVVEGDIRNSGRTDLLDFRADRSDLRFGLRFTAPLDQIQERNNYRATQIFYQRARRNYMAAEDAVKQSIRSEWRSLEVLRRNLETSRQAVRIAALQLDSAVEEANAPVEGEGGGRGLGQQAQALLRALSDVLSAQNSLLDIYISYERQRLNIHRDMGKMEIGPDGLWYDSFYQDEANAQIPAEIPFGPSPWWGPCPDPGAAAGWISDSRGGDEVVLAGHGEVVDGLRGREELWSPGADEGDPRGLSGDGVSDGLRRQPEQQDAVQQRGRLNNDHQYPPRRNLGERRRSRVRTRFVVVGR